MNTESRSLILKFGRFFVIGLSNVLILFAILNFLIFTTGLYRGWGLVSLNIIAQIVTLTYSYFINKYWAFKNHQPVRSGEVATFFFVSGCGAGIHSLIVYIITTSIGPLFGISPPLWVNIAALIGSGITLLWNFFGYHFIVFPDRSVEGEMKP